MPRSSFSRNPLLRVSRPVSACSRCRAAKVKCDGKLPACTACEKAGRESECSAANDQFARGKERSYVAALELRIEKLERRLEYAESRKASVSQHDVDGNPHVNLTEADRRDSLAVIRAAIHRKAARNRETSDVNSLVSDFSILSVDATTRDFGPNAGNITFARLVLAAAAKDPLPKSEHFVLPSRQTATTIIQHYITNVYCMIPCFSETALWNILDAVYRNDERIIKDSDHWLLYLVLAIGSVAQSRRFNDDHYRLGVQFVTEATAYADQALTPGYVTQIQSLLLLTMYSMLDPAHFDAWHLIGLTSSAVVDLGLHQDPPSNSISDRSALNMRRKIFYCVYAIDRAISMAHARPFSFTDESVNVAFPQPGSLGDKPASSMPISGPQSVSWALLLFQLRRAQSFWYQALHHSEPHPLPNATAFLWQMCLDMREWQASLPANLPANVREMFEQELRYSYVYCLAPSRRVPQINDYIRILIFEYCLEYLNRKSEFTSDGSSMTLYTYHDALKVYFMASQFLSVLREARDVLLSGLRLPPPQAPPGSVPAPPIPRRALATSPGMPPKSNLERSLECLEQTLQTLNNYGERWQDAVVLGRSFQHSSSDMVEQLRNLVQLPGMHVDQQQHSPFSNSGQPSLSPPSPAVMQMAPGQGPPPPGQASGPGLRWVGVDAAQMMHGGPH